MTLENIESLWFLKGVINFCFGIHWLSSPGFTGPQAETKRSLTHLHSDERFLSSLTHCILVDTSTMICWTSPFAILGVSGLFCCFHSILDRKSC